MKHKISDCKFKAVFNSNADMLEVQRFLLENNYGQFFCIAREPQKHYLIYFTPPYGL